jgi:hypothetical protein
MVFVVKAAAASVILVLVLLLLVVVLLVVVVVEATLWSRVMPEKLTVVSFRQQIPRISR